MADTDTNNDKIDGKEKKKQKAGLNGIRPNDFVEGEFKQMAKDNGLTQTEMFYRIFWSYTNDQKNELKEKALSLEPEVDLIAQNLSSILDVFKAIADKSQNSILSIKNNAEQTEKNLNFDIDTIKKELKEANKRNEELENFTNTFSELKAGLEIKIKTLSESLEDTESKLKDTSDSHKAIQNELEKSNKELYRISSELENSNHRLKRAEAELNDSKDINKENAKTIKEFEKQATIYDKNIRELENEVSRMKQELASKDTTIRGLEELNKNLNTTISTIDKVHKAEIDSVVAKYEEKISSQKSKLGNFEEEKEKEIKQITSNLITKCEADKKSAVADIKLEMSKLYNEYNKALAELNEFKSKRQ